MIDTGSLGVSVSSFLAAHWVTTNLLVRLRVVHRTIASPRATLPQRCAAMVARSVDTIRRKTMAMIIILGATGSLGMHVTEQALAANHGVWVPVRTPARLPADVLGRVTVHQADITALPASQLAALARNQDALIHSAGHVSEGQRFVAFVDHVVTSVETLPASERPVCWFLGGAALLDIGDTGRRGVDLPPIRKTYWPHAENFLRLQSSSLDWRLLCP